MKILYYNWVDYLDPERRGGGVTVYQRNLIEALDGIPGVDAWFLSSGISYDLNAAAPRWAPVRHGPKEHRARRFEIVNSEVLAPSHFSFRNASQISAPATVAQFVDFVEANGPFDVIHFNNLEGLPAEVLDTKARWPNTRFVFSLHNYYPFCPQVNLWARETEHCDYFDEGRACRDCLEKHTEEGLVRKANAVAFLLKRNGVAPGTLLFDIAFGRILRNSARAYRLYGRAAKALRRRLRLPAGAPAGEDASRGLKRLAPLASQFALRRQTFIDMINKNCDVVLGVSERVSQIACKYGIDPAIVRTSYIATRQHEKFQTTQPKPSLVGEDGILTIGYLGYMRRDKGFFFLLEALSDLPKSLAARVRLVVAAPDGGDTAMKALSDLSDHLAGVEYSDGYSHDDLDGILAGVDVGVVPVLWEDNLPQVAIEMHARHIPLLTSDRGGAQELGNSPEFVFPAGDTEAFGDRIASILDGQVDIGAYWRNARAPVSIPDHMQELLAIYRSGAEQAPTAPA